MTGSLRQNIHAVSVANEVRLTKANYKGSVVLVEGQSDKRVYQQFFLQDSCRVITASSRDNVIDSVLILNNDKVEGVLGLADRDVGGLGTFQEVPANVILTDENDLEMMIMCSPTFELVLEELGSGKKIANYVGNCGESLRDSVFRASSAIGALRLVSRSKELNLEFSGMRWRFDQERRISINIDRMYSQIVGSGISKAGWDLDRVKSEVSVVLERFPDSKDICQGHDTVRVLARSLRSLFGNDSSFDSSKGAVRLEKIIRLAYKSEYFYATSMAKEIKTWERNSGFQVLAVTES